MVRAVPVRNLSGPPIGAVGTLIGRELYATPTLSTVWRVEFDGFAEQFYAGSPPGIWFVYSDDIERLETGQRKRA